MEPEEFQRINFIPEWVSNEQLIQLAWHYGKVEEQQQRYRVQPYTEYRFAVLDDRLDEFWYTQRNTKSSRRVWAHQDLTVAIEYCTALNRDLPQAVPQLALSQKVAFINAARRERKLRQSSGPISVFTECTICHRMVKGGHLHDDTN